MMLKALCVALSLSLLAATVISSAANTTTEEAMHENGQDVSILGSSRLGCGHYYFASILECLLDFSNESRKYNGIYLRFRIPKDVVLKILSYLAPVKLSDPAQTQTALNSLYRFEKLYGLNRYVEEITIEQINILKGMESELDPFLERNSDICHNLLISRKDVLGSLGFSLSLKLKGLRPSDLLESLLEFSKLSDDQNAVRTAISMFIEEIVERFDTGDFSDELLEQKVWDLVTVYCYDFGLIRRFAQMLPVSLTCIGYFRFLPIVPFEHYPQYLERCTDKNQPTDAELRALSNLLSYCPMIKRNDPDLQPEYFNQYKELIRQYPFPQDRRLTLDAIISIKHGLLADIAAIDSVVMDHLFDCFGPAIVPLFWDRADFDCVQNHLQSINRKWRPCADLVIDPKRFFMSIIDGQSTFSATGLLRYSLHKVSNTNAKARFEAELFGFVYAVANNGKNLTHLEQSECLVYAMDYAYRTNNDNVVELACSVIRKQILRGSRLFFQHMETMSSLPGLWDGPFKQMYCTLCFPGLPPEDFDWHYCTATRLIKVSIRTVDFETLKLLVASDRDSALSTFHSNLESNVVLPKCLRHFFLVLGYSQDDLLLALCKNSTDPWLARIFNWARCSSLGTDTLPPFHSLWYYFWMLHHEEFISNAGPALVKFYTTLYGMQSRVPVNVLE